MRCNGCWCELEPKAKCIATACGHLYCRFPSAACLHFQSDRLPALCSAFCLSQHAPTNTSCHITRAAVPVQASNVLKALWSQKNLLAPSAKMSSPKSEWMNSCSIASSVIEVPACVVLHRTRNRIVMKTTEHTVLCDAAATSRWSMYWKRAQYAR